MEKKVKNPITYWYNFQYSCGLTVTNMMSQVTCFATLLKAFSRRTKVEKMLTLAPERYTGFIRVREMSGKFKFFQGQGIVREFYVVSGKNECLLKCQGNVREFYNFQLVSNDEKQKMASTVFLTFWIQAKLFCSF